MALVIVILATAQRAKDFERLIFPYYYNDISFCTPQRCTHMCCYMVDTYNTDHHCGEGG